MIIIKSKYVDTSAIIQVIGCTLKNPTILDSSDKYNIVEEDFVDDFHKILFGSIYKLYHSGAKTISIENIQDFLGGRPIQKNIFEEHNGEEYLIKIIKTVNNLDTFDYYYNRMKKMTLLRAMDSHGIDVSFIYDADNILDIRKKQRQEEYLDNCTIEDIVKKIDDKIDEIKEKYSDISVTENYQAGEGIFDLLDNLGKEPAFGSPMYGPIINSVTRGCRLKKFYLRSGGTGLGKSRTMIADTCNLGANKIYDENLGWIKNGVSESVLYISTEQELDEIQTMMLAFLSNVNERKILTNLYDSEEEKERVREAARLLISSPIYIETMPNFSLQDIENTIRRGIREKGVKYVIFDYIHTSMKILEEITKKTGGVKMREDTVLFMISTRLKDICNEEGVFILSGTQLSGDFKASDYPDQSLLRGSKAIADKVDIGMLLLPVMQQDIQSLENILNTGLFEVPNLKISVYKNRQNEFKSVLLWCSADLGTCRVKPMFITDFNYELKSVDNINIKVQEKSAF